MSSAVEESWHLKQGDEIDETLVVIGAKEAGSRYEVFHAWDRTLFCDVAVKVLRPNRLGERHAVAAFEREASVARRLEHPNLVRFLREHLAEPRPYLVLEYVRAQTLEDHLAAHDDVSVPEICLLGIRMCAALAYMHSRSIVHLDVKPANLTMGDPPRLLDLSIARFTPGAVPLGGEVGTSAYMSPEQCRVEPVTIAADIWGLGATLYEGLTGMQPFTSGREASEVLADRYPQLVEDPEPLRHQYPQLPATLDRVILACLRKDPATRPTAREVAVALEGVLENFRIDELLAWPRGLPIERPPGITVARS